ncbi:NADP-dependent oxidoreductase domain-containing protein, partial [Suillus occidentalis]
VKQSLERFQLDYIDLLQCIFDKETPIEEMVMHASIMHDVVQAGYVRYIRISSCWAYQCAYMLHFCSIMRLQTNSLLSFHAKPLYREEECEIFPTLKVFGVGSTPWPPLARSALIRPLGQQTDRGQTDS